MKTSAERGDTVAVHYKGTLSDGTVFDSSEGEQPLEFTIGAHEVIDGFENAVTGMNVGDKKTADIPAEDAYGHREDDLVFHVPRSSMQNGLDIEVGDFVRVTLPDGQTAPMQVVGLDAEAVTLDANHPLAGKTLTFELELMEIK
jgi:FKBP-type peptidyl-prolyl cis-trans isomerase 2